MKEDILIDDIIAMLDDSMDKGCGHINIQVNAQKEVEIEKLEAGDEEILRTVEKIGCTTCSQ